MKNLLYIILISIGPNLFAQNELKDLVAKNEKAVCTVYTYDDFGVPNGLGTGFFINNSGIGITNYHVLESASSAIVKLNDGKTYKIIEILSASKDADLIKFKVENTSNKIFNSLSLKLTPVQKGEKLFVIGNPHGFESTVSEGIVSSIRDAEGYEQVIQITAPISPGSSGSPVMTMDGGVIGIATFQYNEGQNLNFAVTSKMINKIPLINKKLIAHENKNFLVINEVCKTNTELVLNSIEYSEDKTTLNFSFTNVSLGYGDNMIIWTKLNTKTETFYIQDLNTTDKYYALGSNIGTSRDNATKVALGETKRFKVYFPPIPKSASKISIMEGISSTWNFLDLELSKYFQIENQGTDNYEKQYALTKLENKDFKQAKALLSTNTEKNKKDHGALNIMGIISYLMDNNYDALNYFTQAIDLSPTNGVYYFNRYTLYYRGKKDYEKALEDITSAIKITPNQGDYYQHRGQVYMALKEYKKANSDFDIAINQMGDNWYCYKLRGNCKSWLSDWTGACNDWKEAYKLSDYSDEQLKETIKKQCR